MSKSEGQEASPITNLKGKAKQLRGKTINKQK